MLRILPYFLILLVLTNGSSLNIGEDGEVATDHPDS